MKTGNLAALKSVPQAKNIYTALALLATGSAGAVTNQSAARLDFNSLNDYHEGLLRWQVRTDGGVGATPTAVGGGVTFTLKYAFADESYDVADAPTILQNAAQSLVLPLPNAISVKATGTLTLTGLPTAGQTVTISTLTGVLVTYTYVAALTGKNYEVLIGASAAATAQNLVAAITDAAVTAGIIRGAAAAHPDVTATDNGAGVVTVTARDFGTAYNAITTTETSSNQAFGAGTLTGGTAGATRLFVSDNFLHGGRYLYTWFDRDAFAANGLINVTAKLIRL